MKAALLISLPLAVVVAFVVFEGLFVVFNGSKVPTPNIPRQPLAAGKGSSLNYVVLGDSTAVAQGADYQQGFAVATTQHLAADHAVTMYNLAVSGARTADVLNQQLPQMPKQVQKLDLVLIAVGPNDVTHLTSSTSVKNSLQKITDQLVRQNCDVKIVLTGSAQMGAVPRFPQPLRALMGWRTTQLNKIFDQVINQKQLTFAPIAKKTGPTFEQNPALFAPDKFHPNAEGYAIWIPVLNAALDDALASQPSHCAD